MFTSIKNWIQDVRSSDISRQRRVLVWMVVISFILICGIWFVAMQLGFIDWEGDWIAGTRTYDASGKIESSMPDTESMGQKWNETKRAVGDAFRNIENLFGSAVQQMEVSASSTASTSSLVPSFATSTPE
ncbi:MAG: hypothetical protein WC099_00315 [Candidatus Paceibacterota bacterium]